VRGCALRLLPARSINPTGTMARRSLHAEQSRAWRAAATCACSYGYNRPPAGAATAALLRALALVVADGRAEATPSRSARWLGRARGRQSRWTSSPTTGQPSATHDRDVANSIVRDIEAGRRMRSSASCGLSAGSGGTSTVRWRCPRPQRCASTRLLVGADGLGLQHRRQLDAVAELDGFVLGWESGAGWAFRFSYSLWGSGPDRRYQRAGYRPR